MTFHSENIDSVGFRRAALLAFLSLDGIHLPELDANPAPLTTPAPPWAEARRGLKRLSLSEAANVLIGIDPLDNEWRGEEEFREFQGARRIISDAVDDGEIQSVDIDLERNGELIFNTSDLRAWAASVGRVWPIPEIVAIPGAGQVAAPQAGHRELLARLQDSERERNELRAEVEKLRAEAKHATDQTTALAEQAAQIGKLQADFDSSQNEIRELKSEIGQGKGVSTWQKLVIGMAVERYGYRLDASRSPTAADISAALGSVGIEVTAETVRNCLRTAADAHLSKRR